MCEVHIGIMSTETENNLMDKRKEPLDKNWKSSTIKYDTQLFAENQIEFMKRQPKQTQM